MPAKRFRAKLAILFAAPLFCASAFSNAAPNAQPTASYKYDAPTATVEPDGKLKASIEATVPIDCQRAFEVFTDYEGMTRFLPGMEMSKVQSRSGNKVVLSQRGTVAYGIFVKQYTSTRELTIDAPRRIDSASLPTDELPISSTAIFREAQGRCVIGYTTRIGIPSWTPGFAAVGFAKSIAATQMTALLAEMKKRNLSTASDKDAAFPTEQTPAPASTRDAEHEPAPERSNPIPDTRPALPDLASAPSGSEATSDGSRKTQP